MPKYKQMYESSQYDLRQANRKLDDEKEKRIKAEAELQAIQIRLDKIEYGESVVKEENDWLRDTVRLLALDESKMKKLAEHIEDERIKREEMIMGDVRRSRSHRRF